MSFNWVDYLRLAEALQANPDIPGPREASLRAATSRAYYAAFQCAMNFAKSEGFQPKYTGEDHWNIKRHFQYYQPNNSDIRGKISVALERMYDNRRKADYSSELEKISPNALAQLTIKMAQGVLEKLNTLKTGKDSTSES
jgi:uncharacterized protein (UPF0332 family)